MSIALTGTPGVGKSSVAKILAKNLSLEYKSDLKLAEKYGRVKGYDEKRKAKIIDEEKLQSIKVKQQWLIEGHLAHWFSVDKVIVLRLKPEKLRKQLKARDWSKEKVDENVEAELLGICSFQARQLHKKVWDLDCTEYRPSEVAERAVEILKSKPSQPIDWLTNF